MPIRPLRRKSLLLVGCGDVGQRIGRLLHRRMRVIGTVRTESTALALRQAGIKPVMIDLDQPRQLARAAAFAAWTIYLAPPPAAGTADSRLKNWLEAVGAHRARQARLSRFGDSRFVLAKSNRPGAPHAKAATPRLVYLSTTGVYGDQGGAWIDETTPARPTTARAIRRLDAEQQILETIARRRSGQSVARSTRLRVPGIYAGDRLPEQRLRSGLPVAEAAGDVYTNHIHADDLARLSFLALLRGRSGRVFNTIDASDLTIGQWLDQVADALKLPRPPRVPREELARHVNPMMLSFLNESRRIDGRRALRELRSRLRWPTVASFLASLSQDTED